MIDLVSDVATFLTFACKDLKSLNSIEGFTAFLKKFNFDGQVINSIKFADFPTKNSSLLNVKDPFFAQLYFISLKIQKGMIENKIPTFLNMRILFIETINGPWLALDLKNEAALTQVSKLCCAFGHFTKLQQGYFIHNLTPNYLKFTYYIDFDVYAAIISTNIEDLDHTIYANNKIAEYFAKM